MALLIEAYESQGAISLAREFNLQELNLLLAQTAELRRDPEERQQEIDREEAKLLMEQNRGRKMSVRSAGGQVETVDLSEFEFVD